MALAMLGRIKPLICHKIIVPGGPAFSAACFEGDTWSLKPLQRAGDERSAPDLAARVGQALLGLGARYAYAPTPTKFNGRIIPTDLLYEEIPLGRVVMYRNPDAPADGTWLSTAGSSGVFSAAGCSMIVAVLGKEMVFAHAGRDCVIDRTRIKTRGRGQGRHRESVVNYIVASLAPSQTLRKQVRVWVFYSIRPENFLHSLTDVDAEHLKYNIPAKEMLPGEYGESCKADEKGVYIDVPGIIRQQFMSMDVPQDSISLEHAYLSDEDDLPTTRNGDNTRRYLAAIVRHT